MEEVREVYCGGDGVYLEGVYGGNRWCGGEGKGRGRDG